jgi:hypothetical protein
MPILAAEREVRRLSTRSWWLDTSRAARRVTDLMHFGSGTAERLAATLVIGAGFLLLFLGGAVAAGAPPKYGAAAGVGSLVVGLVLTTALVTGRSDEALEKAAVSTRTELAAARREALLARREEAAEGAARARRPRSCPYCRELIPASALKCSHCGEIVDEDWRREREEELRPQSNPGVAAVLSFLFPGLGQLYRGRVASGLIWFVCVLVGYVCCILPGFVLHWLCIFSAASGRR